MSTLYTTSPHGRRYVRELPAHERPLNRLKYVGARGLRAAELLALALGAPDALDLADEVLAKTGGLHNLTRFTMQELAEIPGIGEARAGVLVALAEVGRRLIGRPFEDRPRIVTPMDAANLLMTEMMDLEQEHLRLVLLDTRNRLIDCPTVYIGNINCVVVRAADIFRHVVRANSAAFILVHNHPTGDASPSPEDIKVTRHLVQASRMMDCELLDHLILGRQRYTSLKECGLGFDEVMR